MLRASPTHAFERASFLASVKPLPHGSRSHRPWLYPRVPSFSRPLLCELHTDNISYIFLAEILLYTRLGIQPHVERNSREASLRYTSKSRPPRLLSSLSLIHSNLTRRPIYYGQEACIAMCICKLVERLAELITPARRGFSNSASHQSGLRY